MEKKREMNEINESKNTYEDREKTLIYLNLNGKYSEESVSFSGSDSSPSPFDVTKEQLAASFAYEAPLMKKEYSVPNVKMMTVKFPKQYRKRVDNIVTVENQPDLMVGLTWDTKVSTDVSDIPSVKLGKINLPKEYGTISSEVKVPEVAICNVLPPRAFSYDSKEIKTNSKSLILDKRFGWNKNVKTEVKKMQKVSLKTAEFPDQYISEKKEIKTSVKGISSDVRLVWRDKPQNEIKEMLGANIKPISIPKEINISHAEVNTFERIITKQGRLDWNKRFSTDVEKMPKVELCVTAFPKEYVKKEEKLTTYSESLNLNHSIKYEKNISTNVESMPTVELREINLQSTFEIADVKVKKIDTSFADCRLKWHTRIPSEVSRMPKVKMNEIRIPKKLIKASEELSVLDKNIISDSSLIWDSTVNTHVDPISLDIVLAIDIKDEISINTKQSAYDFPEVPNAPDVFEIWNSIGGFEALMNDIHKLNRR